VRGQWADQQGALSAVHDAGDDVVGRFRQRGALVGVPRAARRIDLHASNSNYFVMIAGQQRTACTMRQRAVARCPPRETLSGTPDSYPPQYCRRSQHDGPSRTTTRGTDNLLSRYAVLPGPACHSRTRVAKLSADSSAHPLLKAQTRSGNSRAGASHPAVGLTRGRALGPRP
jgi:hypothetical protein